MPNYIKVKTGSSSWSTATKAYVKKSTGWVQPIRIWMKFLSGWTRVWPISGPFALTSPFIASTASGSTHLMPTSPIRVGTIYYGRNGTWDANGWTISSYSYQWRRYNLQSAADDTGQTNRSSGTFASPSAPYTPTSSDNKKYLSFYIKPNTTDTFEMSEAESGDDDGRLFAITQIPLNTSVSLTATSQVGTVITLSSSWNTSDARQIETSRTKVAWYKNTTASFTGATLIKNNLSSVAGAYSYTPVIADQNNYIIARETAFNSGSDYSDGVLTLANTVGSGTEVGVTAQAISGLVTAAIAAPTISSITASSIGGPVSVSFTGGSGPFYQMFWWGTATAPTGITNPDASGSASPLTDNTGPTSTANQYMYVRSVTTQSDTGVANATTISPWSDGVSFNMNPAPALTPTFGANTSTANGFTGSVTNYDSAYNWNTPSSVSSTLTNGTWTWGTASGSTRPFTVTGLSASQSSTATVTTTRADYASGSNSTTGTALALAQYTVTWTVNLSGATVSPASNTVNSGTSVTAPTPTRNGYTFLYWRDGTTVFNYVNQINPGGSWTVNYNITFYAWWSLNPVIPSNGTVSISTNTGNYNVGSIITYSTSGWADTPTSYSLRLYNGTNPVLTSDPLRASTSSASGTYTIVAGDVPNYFKAFATASNSAGTSTEASSTQVGPAVSSFVTPTAGPPQVSNNQLGFIRSGTSVTWYSDYPSTSGDVSYIIGMEWQIRTTNSTTTTPLNTGTYAGGGSGDGLQGNTTKYMTYPVSTPYPYSAAGTIWAFRIKSTENTAATSSSRFARARVIMMGTNGTVYFGTWSTNI